MCSDRTPARFFTGRECASTTFTEWEETDCSVVRAFVFASDSVIEWVSEFKTVQRRLAVEIVARPLARVALGSDDIAAAMAASVNGTIRENGLLSNPSGTIVNNSFTLTPRHTIDCTSVR